MSTLIVDIEQLYQRTFGSKPYRLEPQQQTPSGESGYKVPPGTANVMEGSRFLTTDAKGVEVWLPVWFTDLPEDIGDKGTLFLPYTVVRVTGSSTIVRTPLAERRGSVKEQFNVDDYKISIKGFFIDKDQRLFPEKDLENLKKLHEAGRAFKLVNALTDIFLTDVSMPAIEQNRVVMTGFDLPEVEGGRKHVRPFSMTLESDCVFTLEVE